MPVYVYQVQIINSGGVLSIQNVDGPLPVFACGATNGSISLGDGVADSETINMNSTGYVGSQFMITTQKTKLQNGNTFKWGGAEIFDVTN